MSPIASIATKWDLWVEDEICKNSRIDSSRESATPDLSEAFASDQIRVRIFPIWRSFETWTKSAYVEKTQSARTFWARGTYKAANRNLFIFFLTSGSSRGEIRTFRKGTSSCSKVEQCQFIVRSRNVDVDIALNRKLGESKIGSHLEKYKATTIPVHRSNQRQ